VRRTVAHYAAYWSRASFFVNVTLRPSVVRTFARTVTVVPVNSTDGSDTLYGARASDATCFPLTK
jgi:hypothetical protein